MYNTLRLVKPTTALKEEYLSYYKEWIESKETIIPWVVQKNPADFDAMLQFLQNNEKGINIPEGWIPDSTYWLVNESNRILGVVNIRHSLTAFLMNAGGHIGYGIRPSERRKGYATQILALALEKSKALGIEKVLVVCDEVNTASMKTIVKNGGIQAEDFVEDDGNVILRYWIG